MSDLRELPKKVDDMALQVSQLRAEMHGEFSAVRAELKEGDEETRRQMRVLHEEVISRIALLQEGVARGSRKRARGHS